MTDEDVITKRKNCPYVILSRARGFGKDIPMPTCKLFPGNHEDDALGGTYEPCSNIAINGKCKIKDMKEYEENKINRL